MRNIKYNPENMWRRLDAGWIMATVCDNSTALKQHRINISRLFSYKDFGYLISFQAVF